MVISWLCNGRKWKDLVEINENFCRNVVSRYDGATPADILRIAWCEWMPRIDWRLDNGLDMGSCSCFGMVSNPVPDSKIPKTKNRPYSWRRSLVSWYHQKLKFYHAPTVQFCQKPTHHPFLTLINLLGICLIGIWSNNRGWWSQRSINKKENVGVGQTFVPAIIIRSLVTETCWTRWDWEAYGTTKKKW